MSTRGTITYRRPRGRTQRGTFELDLDPDVRMRVKRILPKVSVHSRTLKVVDSDETAADMAMILTRWDLEADEQTLARIRGGDRSMREKEETVEAILSGKVLTNPEAMEPARPLREYQKQAHAVARASGGLLLADELGLGKTASSLASLGDPAMRPMLVVTLAGLPRQWIRELKVVYPDLTAHEIKGTTPYELRDGDGQWPDLIAMNYAKLAGWAAHLDGKVRTVVFDEVHELRRPGSQKYRAAKLVASGADLVWGLSATPVMNYGGEMHAIMNILDPSALGDRQEFAREWCSTSHGLDQKTPVDDPESLRSFLTSRGSMLRRSRSDVGIDLPPVMLIDQSVESDEGAIKRAESDVAEIARLILDSSAEHKVRWAAKGELDWKLRQATGIAKAPFVAAFVKLLLESEEKIAVMAWHRSVIDILSESLASYGVGLYTGTETPNAKMRTLDRFIDGDDRVLIMSLRSGAGIDGLQGVCQNVVFAEYDWSPGVHKQVIGRFHRPGQTGRTFAYFCDSDSGSDPIMKDTLNIKAMQADLLIAPDTDAMITDPDAGRDHRAALAQSILDRTGTPAPSSAAA